MRPDGNVAEGDVIGALRLFRETLPLFSVSVGRTRVGGFFRLGRGRLVSVDARTGDVTTSLDEGRAVRGLHRGERFSVSRDTVDVLALCVVERGGDPDRSVPFLSAHSFPVDCPGWSGHALLGMSDQVTLHAGEFEAVEEALPEMLWRSGWSDVDGPYVGRGELRRLMSGVPRLLAAA